MKKSVIICLCVLLAFAACSKKGVATKTKEKPINAQAVFSDNCARCHGADGKTGRAPDLSRCSLDKGGLVGMITKGEGRMPSFEDKLSQREIDALANFVLALKN